MPVMTATNDRLGQMLRTSVHLPNLLAFPHDAIDHASQRAAQSQCWLGRQLVNDGIISGNELALLISQEYQIPLLDLTTYQPDPAALVLLDETFCQQQLVLPLGLSSAGLFLAMANPLDQELVEYLKSSVRQNIAIGVAALDALATAIPAFYHAAPDSLPTETMAPAATPFEIYRHRGGDSCAEDEPTPYPLSLGDLLTEVIRLHGSDLHLTAGTMPSIRVRGELTAIGAVKLKPHHIQAFADALMTPDQQELFARTRELDFSFGVCNLGRFRGNIYLQRGSLGITLRSIPSVIPTLEQLKMPPVLFSFVTLERGLVLVTGPTGSGKSTTLAAIIDEMNRTRKSHIVTMEDPIEYVHWHNKCIINQRQVGMDTNSFLDALKHVLRQDPDIILIGELRDLETISAAMTAAETGHVVFATLHTNSATQTIDRIVDVFPADQQPQIRLQLANVIQGVVSQVLIPTADGTGRVCAQEIMIATPAVRTLIRDGKSHQLASVLESGVQSGMQTMDRALCHLVAHGVITVEQALRYCTDPDTITRR